MIKLALLKKLIILLQAIIALLIAHPELQTPQPQLPVGYNPNVMGLLGSYAGVASTTASTPITYKVRTGIYDYWYNGATITPEQYEIQKWKLKKGEVIFEKERESTVTQ